MSKELAWLIYNRDPVKTRIFHEAPDPLRMREKITGNRSSHRPVKLIDLFHTVEMGDREHSFASENSHHFEQRPRFVGEMGESRKTGHLIEQVRSKRNRLDAGIDDTSIPARGTRFRLLQHLEREVHTDQSSLWTDGFSDEREEDARSCSDIQNRIVFGQLEPSYDFSYSVSFASIGKVPIPRGSMTIKEVFSIFHIAPIKEKPRGNGFSNPFNLRG